MKYAKSKNINMEKACFHFTRTANRNSIEKSGIKSVADGENETGSDKDHKTIFFSYGKEGLIENLNSWIRWEYNRALKERPDYNDNLPHKGIDEKLMKETYERVYNDFKDRIYYKLDIEEGKDFSFDQIDYKKEDDFNSYKKELSNFENGEQKWKPDYPNKVVSWMYGNYSNFENGNTKVDKWNMFTKENLTIEPDKLSIMETEDGRSDALSFIMESYDNYKDEVKDKGADLSTIDSFMDYAKEKYKLDKDYEKDSPDLGRREISSKEEKKYQEINGTKEKSEEVKESFTCRKSLMQEASKYIQQDRNKEKQEQTKEENNKEGMM